MRVIGLTGGIASGKSLVSEQLAERGAIVVNADKVGHEAYRRGTETYRAVVEAFGPEVVGPEGEIDRRALGAKVFADPEARRRLEEIVWPAMRRMMEERLAELRAGGAQVAVLEAALLIEADWLPLVDEVWLVTASPETARRRLMERNGLSPEQAEERLRAQLTNEKRRSYADVIIENDGSLEELRRAVDEAWSKLEARAGEVAR
ncbi:MAG: dephospho-CoA kinase [Chloroflexi bacterium RBG_16_68_14]|nr:MAG: dephospho-CoA kinase [Chloroflexi bacterium RBG_16_68_14]